MRGRREHGKWYYLRCSIRSELLQATRGSKRRREGQPEAPAMSTSKADAVESERERCGDDSERMTDSGVDAGEGDGGLAPESEIVVVVESAGQTEATAGDGVQLQKTGTKRRVTVHPPVPVTETLASIDWEREMSSLVTGRAFVQTGAPLKSTLLKSISRVQEFQRATAGGIAAHLTSGVAPHASMISIHVALDAAKDLSTMYALHHAGRMISSGSLLAMAHGYVRIMKWCLEDGPRFADWVFRDVLTEGSPRPVGVEWVDNLVKEVHRAVLQGATPRARRGKEKKGKKKDDEDEEEQSRWLMEDIEVPIMWLADRERALRSERGRGLGAEVEDGEESGNDDPNDDDYEPSSSDESSSDDDDTDFPTRDGTSSQPDDGAAVPRSSFAATIPLTRADGKPSGTAALVGKKVRVKTKTLTLEFGTYENSPVRRYQALTTALVDTLFEVLLAPGLRRVQPLLEMVIDRKSREKARVQEKQMVPEEDEGDPKEKAGKSKGKAGGTNGSAIQQHMAIAIARGWALEALREGAGTDIVWSSEAIASIWLFVHTYRKTWSHSPFRMIKPLRSAHRNAYQGRTGVVFPKDLAAFRSEIVSWFANNPSATAALQSYGEHYRYHLAELEGGSSEKFAATVPELFRKEERKHDGRGNGEATRSQRTSVRARKPRVGASPREITNLPSKQDWALPTLMLDLAWRREQRRLGEHDVLEDSVGAAETFFTGGDPHDRSASDKRTSDQMNPVLVFQETHKLLEKAIGKDQIRDPRYLKNLVLAIATGQSMRTRKFLEVWMDKMPRDAAEMAELYEERVRLNDVERAKYPVKDDDDPHSERWLAAHGDYWQLHDIAVYGAPSNAFSFDGGKAITRVFGDTLDRWLTGFLETHPDPGTQVSWEEMGKEISSWNIPPFTGDAGLGKLHLQHHLARRGLCRSATVPELGRWINVNRARGAFRGLTDLGFRPLLDENAVVHALQMTHDHLEVALPSQIRTAMDFGPALVENFLCKVHRTWGDLDTLKGAKGMSEKWVEGWLTEYFKHERIVDLRDWNGEQRLESCSVYG
ncbi:hypothetical protein EXIGLDRAFT_138455 [Exidia glandulosa HHB12029]|uniref:Uncharacterized protein n=1 Tax=Exidia glandulosa HHB12029 TaxID=1314781 RepID=A0A165FZM3_EXIGL|nr:hypothetical protein EXIGLDRAFT_138455 [Exidia glandulosa HHB12029]